MTYVLDVILPSLWFHAGAVPHAQQVVLVLATTASRAGLSTGAQMPSK